MMFLADMQPVAHTVAISGSRTNPPRSKRFWMAVGIVPSILEVISAKLLLKGHRRGANTFVAMLLVAVNFPVQIVFINLLIDHS